MRLLISGSFGNAFSEACRAAGIRKSAHGLRKLAATRAANAGANIWQLNAMFGWTGTEMASHYTVGLYITSAYWFTASTSFANPAVTIARSLSDTFAGIAPAGVLAFIAAQTVGALSGVLIASLLYRPAVASSA